MIMINIYLAKAIYIVGDGGGGGQIRNPDRGTARKMYEKYYSVNCK